MSFAIPSAPLLPLSLCLLHIEDVGLCMVQPAIFQEKVRRPPAYLGISAAFSGKGTCETVFEEPIWKICRVELQLHVWVLEGIQIREKKAEELH